jgi:hypothetical protein
VAVQTLVRRSDNRPVAVSAKPTVRRAVHVTLSPKRTAPTDAGPKPSKLEEIEDRLIADALERHAHADVALTGVVDDISALTAELHDSRRRPLLLRSTTSLNRVEDRLLEAVLRTHPNRERAFDRLLEDISNDQDGELTRARFDMSIDNDFDGLS